MKSAAASEATAATIGAASVEVAEERDDDDAGATATIIGAASAEVSEERDDAGATAVIIGAATARRRRFGCRSGHCALIRARYNHAGMRWVSYPDGYNGAKP